MTAFGDGPCWSPCGLSQALPLRLLGAEPPQCKLGCSGVTSHAGAFAGGLWLAFGLLGGVDSWLECPGSGAAESLRLPFPGAGAVGGTFQQVRSGGWGPAGSAGVPDWRGLARWREAGGEAGVLVPQEVTRGSLGGLCPLVGGLRLTVAFARWTPSHGLPLFLRVPWDPGGQ